MTDGVPPPVDSAMAGALRFAVPAQAVHPTSSYALKPLAAHYANAMAVSTAREELRRVALSVGSGCETPIMGHA